MPVGKSDVSTMLVQKNKTLSTAILGVLLVYNGQAPRLG